MYKNNYCVPFLLILLFEICLANKVLVAEVES